MNQRGKHFYLWQKTRAQWFRDNAADHYICYICGRWLLPEETTLDHVKSRSSRPDLRYEPTNLRPACWICNSLKGSKSA